MTRINKEAQKAKKETARAIQYPRTEVPAQTPVEVAEEVELSYRELQAKAKSLGLKASGSADTLKERIAAT